ADVFYFGNAIGDAGNHPADAQVTAQDELLARASPRNLVDNPAPIDFACDYNRDRKVDAVDQLIARTSKTNFTNALNLIALPATTTLLAASTTRGPAKTARAPLSGWVPARAGGAISA